MTRRLFIAFLLLHVAIASGHLTTMDDQTYFYALDAFFTDGSLAVKITEEERHLNLVEGMHGLRYPYYGCGGMILHAPLYLAGRLAGAVVGRSHYITQAAMSLLNAVLGALAIVCIHRIARRAGVAERDSLRGAILFGVTTIALVWTKYAYTSVALGALFILALDLLDVRSVLAGAVLGLALNLRYDAAIGIILLISIPILERQWNKVMRLTIGFAPFLVLALAYNAARFGSPFDTGQPEVAAGDAFSHPLAAGAVGLLLMPARGLLFYSPAIFVAAWGWRHFPVSRARRIVLAVILPASYTCFYAKYIVWHGAASWGPRFLGCVIPIIGLGFASMPVPSRAPFRRAFTALAIVAIAVQLWGTTVSVDSYYDELVESGIDPMRAAYEPALSPLWGIYTVAQRFDFRRIRADVASMSLPQGGYPDTVNLRRTPDYWPFYAHKVGVPGFLCAAAWLAVAAGLVKAGIPLARRAFGES